LNLASEWLWLKMRNEGYESFPRWSFTSCIDLCLDPFIHAPLKFVLQENVTPVQSLDGGLADLKTDRDLETEPHKQRPSDGGHEPLEVSGRKLQTVVGPGWGTLTGDTCQIVIGLAQK
jgi:hypothetical protein